MRAGGCETCVSNTFCWCFPGLSRWFVSSSPVACSQVSVREIIYNRPSAQRAVMLTSPCLLVLCACSPCSDISSFGSVSTTCAKQAANLALTGCGTGRLQRERRVPCTRLRVAGSTCRFVCFETQTPAENGQLTAGSTQIHAAQAIAEMFKLCTDLGLYELPFEPTCVSQYNSHQRRVCRCLATA